MDDGGEERGKGTSVSADKLPSTVYFFSDLEGSTQLWERFPAAMKENIVRHDEIIDGLIHKHGGKVIDHAGDGVFAVFEAGTPLHCALEIQRQLQDEPWQAVDELRVRMGLHAGAALKRGEDYRGPMVNRTARIMSTGWGGQILLTPEVERACPRPEGAQLQDLGAHLLKDLHAPQPILGLVHPALKLQTFPELRSLSAQPNNLPPQPNAFVGRTRELAEISEHFEDPHRRLVTLLGPGGVGKTRLALQAAAEAVERFKHGVFFVYLAPLSSPNQVVSSMAEALGFSFYSREEPKDQLLNFLREKELLLVLDNLEHLMAMVALMRELLEAAPRLTLLATSRERLNLSQESVLEIRGLDVPGEADLQQNPPESFGALRLFAERARQVEPAFALDEATLPGVLRVCRLVDGIPLGIELAAAWVRMLPPTEIAAEIEAKLDFLESSMHDVPERHRSLRAAFEYSWNLLDEDEREAYRNLSALRGSWDREVAARVAGVSLRTLAGLADKSLVRKTAAGRFYVHEVLRHHAVEKRAEDPEAQAALEVKHGTYFADFMAERAAKLRGREQVAALEAVQANLDNVLAAWRWALEANRADCLGRALDALWLFYEKRSRFREGLETFRAAAEDWGERGGDAALGGKLWAREGYFAQRLGELEAAGQRLEWALEEARRADDAEEVAFCLNYLGQLALRRGRFDQARTRLEESLALRRERNAPRGIAASLNNLGALAYLTGEHARAKACYEESLGLAQRSGDLWSVGALRNNLGEIHRLLGEREAARAQFEASLQQSEQLGDRWGAATAHNNLGALAHMAQDWDEARRLYAESLRVRRELGDRSGVAVSLRNLAEVAGRQGEPEQARGHAEESLRISRELGDRRGEAASLVQLGKADRQLGDAQGARERLREGVSLAQEIGALPVALDGVVCLADALDPARASEALALLAAARAHPAAHRTTQRTADALISSWSDRLTRGEADAALARGRGASWEETLQAALGT